MVQQLSPIVSVHQTLDLALDNILLAALALLPPRLAAL